MRLLRVILTTFVLVGCDKKSPPAPAPDSSAIAIAVDSHGFKPNSVKLKKGVPATLVFTRTSDETCATEVAFPDLGIKKELPIGQAVAVTIPTDKARTLAFQCGMGMYKSSVVIASD